MKKSVERVSAEAVRASKRVLERRRKKKRFYFLFFFSYMPYSFIEFMRSYFSSPLVRQNVVHFPFISTWLLTRVFLMLHPNKPKICLCRRQIRCILKRKHIMKRNNKKQLTEGIKHREKKIANHIEYTRKKNRENKKIIYFAGGKTHTDTHRVMQRFNVRLFLLVDGGRRKKTRHLIHIEQRDVQTDIRIYGEQTNYVHILRTTKSNMFLTPFLFFFIVLFIFSFLFLVFGMCCRCRQRKIKETRNH